MHLHLHLHLHLQMLTEMRNLRTNWKTLIAEAYEGDKTDLALSSSSSSGVKLCAPNPGTYANVEYADRCFCVYSCVLLAFMSRG